MEGDVQEEKLIIKTFRLEPSIWDLLEQHRQHLGAQSRTDALRLLIKGAKVKPAQVKIGDKNATVSDRGNL